MHARFGLSISSRDFTCSCRAREPSRSSPFSSRGARIPFACRSQPLDTRTERQLHDPIFQRRGEQRYQCKSWSKSWISRQFFFQDAHRRWPYACAADWMEVWRVHPRILCCRHAPITRSCTSRTHRGDRDSPLLVTSARPINSPTAHDRTRSANDHRARKRLARAPARFGDTRANPGSRFRARRCTWRVPHETTAHLLEREASAASESPGTIREAAGAALRRCRHRERNRGEQRRHRARSPNALYRCLRIPKRTLAGGARTGNELALCTGSITLSDSRRSSHLD